MESKSNFNAAIPDEKGMAMLAPEFKAGLALVHAASQQKAQHSGSASSDALSSGEVAPRGALMPEASTADDRSIDHEEEAPLKRRRRSGAGT